MWQTCISADKQPLKRGEIERRKVRESGWHHLSCQHSLTVMGKTWNNLHPPHPKKKNSPQNSSFSACPQFTVNLTVVKPTWQKHRKYVSGNLSVWEIKNISLPSRMQAYTFFSFFYCSTLLSQDLLSAGSLKSTSAPRLERLASVKKSTNIK